MIKKQIFFGISALCLLCSGGCGSQKKTDFNISRQPYEKSVFSTDTAARGDLEPTISLKLQTDGYERINYDSLETDLELEKVYVSVGDHVKKGDMLVSFQCDTIQQTIEDYREKITENRLLISHYEKLMNINPQMDYREDITSLKKDVRVAELYLEENEKKLESYQIKAKRDGKIIKINDRLADGIYEAGRALITQASGSGKYQADRPDNYTFHKGETYVAMQDAVSYPVCVEKITKEHIIFKPKVEMDGVSEQEDLTLTISLPRLTDVVYVPAADVHHGEDSGEKDFYFVYILDENGYRDAVVIQPGGRVGDYMVVKEGLQGGEKVCR